MLRATPKRNKGRFMMPSPVAAIPPADAQAALVHFERLLSLEADCWDVHESLRLAAVAGHKPDFVLLHVNSNQAGFDGGHIEGATFLHHSTMSEETMAAYAPDTLFVVYCSGPHCNGADRAAANLARLGRPVKKMIGGVAGWLDEGFTLVSS